MSLWNWIFLDYNWSHQITWYIFFYFSLIWTFRVKFFIRNRVCRRTNWLLLLRPCLRLLFYLLSWKSFTFFRNNQAFLFFLWSWFLNASSLIEHIFRNAILWSWFSFGEFGLFLFIRHYRRLCQFYWELQRQIIFLVWFICSFSICLWRSDINWSWILLSSIRMLFFWVFMMVLVDFMSLNWYHFY